MSDGAGLGEFEQLVLLAILNLGPAAHAIEIRARIESAALRRVSRGALYATLDRLKEKGFISYRVAEGGEEREGRPKRYYSIENAGRQALIEAEHARHSLVPNLKSALA